MSELTQPEKLVQRFFEALNDEDEAAFFELFDPGARIENSGDATDVDTLWAAELAMFEAFPDHDHEIATIIADETGAAVEFTFSGTHKGEYDGISPTGNSVFVHGQCVLTSTNESIMEWRVVSNMLEFYKQMGAVKAPYEHRYEAFR